MSLVAPPDELFSWLKKNRVLYVVLRDAHRVRVEPLKDIDLLIEDRAIAALRKAFASRRNGLKIDYYGVNGLYGSDYHGFAHLPQALGERILARRRQVDGVWLAQPDDELNALLYHVVYHKNIQSGFHWCDATRSTPGTYSTRIAELQEQCGVALSLTHESFHAHLVSHNLAIDEERLVAYLEDDFRHGRKSLFHAQLQNGHAGELNLFVIRAIAVKHHKATALLNFLADNFQIVTKKPIDWWTRVTNSRRMRGGKWRRGGKPHIAVVVFDPAPVATTPDERQIHPFVFNRNQFIKLQWREWFCQNTAVRSKDNPIHSTDNEAEALAHLRLFFSLEERLSIRALLPTLRREAEH